MKTLTLHANNQCELSEVLSFRRLQWMFLEERDDAVDQRTGSSDIVPVQMLLVIVVASIDVDATASEELLQFVQNMHALLSLNHRKTRLDLPADSTRVVSKNRNTEAALTVDEADDPLLDTWPFLLIVRTCRIVTDHAPTVATGSDIFGTAGFSGFPAYSQLHSTPSPVRGAAGGWPTPRNLRTVIVTAAVYRRLDSELRSAEAELTPPLNVPAPGRRQSVYVVLRLSTDLCF